METVKNTTHEIIKEIVAPIRPQYLQRCTDYGKVEFDRISEIIKKFENSPSKYALSFNTAEDNARIEIARKNRDWKNMHNGPYYNKAYGQFERWMRLVKKGIIQHLIDVHKKAEERFDSRVVKMAQKCDAHGFNPDTYKVISNISGLELDIMLQDPETERVIHARVITVIPTQKAPHMKFIVTSRKKA